MDPYDDAYERNMQLILREWKKEKYLKSKLTIAIYAIVNNTIDPFQFYWDIDHNLCNRRAPGNKWVNFSPQLKMILNELG